MSAPSAGAVSAAVRFWPVLCTPSARPAHAPPAISATAVKASPFGLTVMTDAASSAGTAIHEPVSVPIASSAMMAALTAASSRIGHSLLCTRSDQTPASTRAAAPANCTPASTPPATPGCQWRISTRNTYANVEMVNCATTSIALEAWMRHSSDVR